MVEIETYAPDRPAPLWAQLFGKRTRDTSYRFNWGEFAPKGLGFAFEIVHYDDPTLIFAFGWPRVFIHLPRWGWVRRLYPSGYDMERSFGFSLRLTGEFAFDLFWHWGNRCKIFHPPWGWNKRRNDYLSEYLGEDGEWHPSIEMPRSWAPDAPSGPQPWEAKWPYHYMTSCGEAQHVTATSRGRARGARSECSASPCGSVDQRASTSTSARKSAISAAAGKAAFLAAAIPCGLASIRAGR